VGVSASLGAAESPASGLVASVAVGRWTVTTLTITQLDERTYARLRMRAARHGRSVEAEVRATLGAAVAGPEENFLLALRAAMSEVGGVDLQPEARRDVPRRVDL